MNYENYRLETKNRSFLVIRLFMVLVLVKLPKGEMFISTNELYLSLVIESLFDNTNKFTDSGSAADKTAEQENPGGQAMCGRYYINDETAKEIEKLIRQINDSLLLACKERDVYPSGKAPVIIGQNDRMLAEEFTWGFPGFDKKSVIFNARSETALEKKTFRDSVKERRCIIPATGFYEWSEKKDKYFFRSPDHRVLLFAGFYIS